MRNAWLAGIALLIGCGSGAQETPDVSGAAGAAGASDAGIDVTAQAGASGAAATDAGASGTAGAPGSAGGEAGASGTAGATPSYPTCDTPPAGSYIAGVECFIKTGVAADGTTTWGQLTKDGHPCSWACAWTTSAGGFVSGHNLGECLFDDGLRALSLCVRDCSECALSGS